MILEEEKGAPVVLACSALKASYRMLLNQGLSESRFVYLWGDYDLIRQQLQAWDHFMKQEMLQRQFDDLQEPADALKINILKTLEQILEMIIAKFDLA